MAAASSGSNSRLIAVGAAVLLVGVILVLLILRGTIGGDDPGTAAEAPGGEQATEQNAGRDAAEVAAAEQDAAATELVADEEGRAARVELPLDIPEGQEAVTVQASFARGAAALPVAGDRVVAYRLADADAEGGEAEEDEADDEPAEAGDEAVGADDGDDDGRPAGAEAERVLEDLEILGVIGPRPAANDGTLTVVLAVDEDDVPALLPVARDRALWLTLLPDADGADADGDDADATGEGTGDDGDEDSGDDGASATGADDAEDL